MHSYWQDLAWECYMSFSHICTRVMALDLCQKFVSAQYLENKLTEFHQIIYMHLYWQDLAWDYYMSFFAHFYLSYDPWFMPKVCFRSISWEKFAEFHQILYMHLYWQALAWNCYKSFFFANLYQSYGTWFTTKLHFRSISWELIDRISSNCIYAFILIIDKIKLGIVTSLFSQNLYQSYGLDLCQKFVSAQYLENKLTEYHEILYMHSYWQDLVCNRPMAHDWCQNLFLLNIFRFSC